MNDLTKNLLIWAVIAFVLIAVFSKFSVPTPQASSIPYSEFLNNVHNGGVKEVEIKGQTIVGLTSNDDKFVTYSPPDDPQLVADLLKYNVKFQASKPEERSIFWEIVISWVPFLLIIGLWVYIMRQMQGGGGGRGAMSFGKSRARMMTEDQVKVNFNDVAGCDEAKEEVA